MGAAVAGLLVALVAGVFGLGGSALASRREHERWLRQARLEAYTDYLVAVTQATVSGHIRRKVKGAALDELDVIDALEHCESRVLLLGPSEIRESAPALFRTASAIVVDANPDRQHLRVDRQAFIDAASGHLDQPPSRPWLPFRRGNG